LMGVVAVAVAVGRAAAVGVMVVVVAVRGGGGSGGGGGWAVVKGRLAVAVVRTLQERTVFIRLLYAPTVAAGCDVLSLRAPVCPSGCTRMVRA
jgi:hypothetical protein